MRSCSLVKPQLPLFILVHHSQIHLYAQSYCIYLPLFLNDKQNNRQRNDQYYQSDPGVEEYGIEPRIDRFLTVKSSQNEIEYFLMVLRSEYRVLYLFRAKFFLLSKQVIIAKNLNYQSFLETALFFFLYASHAPYLFIYCISYIYLINLYFKQMLIFASFYKKLSSNIQFIYLPSFLSSCKQSNTTHDTTLHVNTICTLKTYTILIPLYQEVNQVLPIVQHFSQMLYPYELLDIRLLVEERDAEMIEFINRIALPHFMSMFVIPNDIVLTKPKALNYAAHFIESEYLVIYDAEDRPEYDQLYKAVKTFQQLGEECICLQGRLSFFNSHENLITFWISIEYILWFKFILPGLEFCKMPLTLGGTSNHFKNQKIKEIGYWDAYNVTEDAELGLRIYVQHYVVRMLDSVTHAEAVVNLRQWLGQRARWSKGFMQTFLIFLQMYDKYKDMTLYHQFMIVIFTGAHAVQFLLIPPMALICYVYDIHVGQFFCLISFVFFSYINAICAIKFHDQRLPSRNLCFLAIVMYPIYFLLHIFAMYIAVFELYYKPFYWRKTMHGLSKESN